MDDTTRAAAGRSVKLMAEAEAWVMIPKSRNKGTEVVLDMHPLVLCKVCEFGEACKNGKGEHGVMCYNSHSASHGWVHEPDWFCADGERRTE